MPTLTIHTSYISEDEELLRSIGQTINHLLGGGHDSRIRIHRPSDAKIAAPVNGYSTMPSTVDISKVTHGRQEMEGILSKLHRELLKNPLIAEQEDDITENVLVLVSGNRWVIDYPQFLKNLNSGDNDFTAEFYAAVGSVVAKERVINIIPEPFGA